MEMNSSPLNSFLSGDFITATEMRLEWWVKPSPRSCEDWHLDSQAPQKCNSPVIPVLRRQRQTEYILSKLTRLAETKGYRF